MLITSFQTNIVSEISVVPILSPGSIYQGIIQDFKSIRLQDFASNFRTPKSMSLYQAYGEILKFSYA